MKKKILNMAVVFIAVLLLCSMVPMPVTAGTDRLTYANFPPASTFPCVQMERWKTEVEKRTEGKVSISTFPGGTLLGAKNMFDGVVMGQADIGCFAMSYHPGRFPILEAVDLPVGWPDALVASRSLWDLYQKYKPDSFRKVKVLTMFTCPPANIMSINPVRSLSDLRGMEIRSAGTGVKVLELLGASPVGMPQSDVPDALHKKVIKGMSSSLEVMKDCNYAEYCRYVTMTNLQVVTFAVVMNLDRWNSLPQDVQRVLDKLALEQVEWTGRYVDNHVNDAMEWSKKKYNVEVITFTEEESARMKDVLKPLINGYIEKAKPDVPAKEVIQTVMELNEKYSLLYGTR